MSPRGGRVAVVGGGVIGQAIAWRARAAGHRVVLVDPRPGSGASWMAGGMLAPLTEAWPGEEDLLDLGRSALARWPDFAAELTRAGGVDPGLRADGTVVVAVDTADRADLQRLAAHLAAHGQRVESLTSREVRRLEPALASTVRGGLSVPGELSVDNRMLLSALAAAGAAHGASPVDVVRASATRVEAGAVHLADSSTVECDVAVVAAGAWSPTVCPALAGWIRPVKGEILRVRTRVGALPAPRRTVRASVEGRPIYLVPRADGELVVGATQYDAGYDSDVTVAGVRDLLRDAETIVPGLAEFALVETSAGLRPGSPDNLPLIGWIEPGVIAAAGHHRNGMLLAPATADAVVDLIDGKPPAEEIRAADPARLGPATTDGRT